MDIAATIYGLLFLLLSTRNTPFVYGKPTSQITAEILSGGLESSGVAFDVLPSHLGTAVSKTVHYVNSPLVTGYSSTVYKPDLSAIHQQAKLLTPTAAVRPVHTIIPKITHIEPEVTFQKIPVDVPIASPVVNEVEVRTPILQNQPAVKSVYSYHPAYYPSASVVHTV